MSQEVVEINPGIPSGLTELDEIIRGFRKSELIVAKNTLGSLGTAKAKYIARYAAYENLQPT